LREPVVSKSWERERKKKTRPDRMRFDDGSGGEDLYGCRDV
jgi:hypothetical protein